MDSKQVRNIQEAIDNEFKLIVESIWNKNHVRYYFAYEDIGREIVFEQCMIKLIRAGIQFELCGKWILFS